MADVGGRLHAAKEDVNEIPGWRDVSALFLVGGLTIDGFIPTFSSIVVETYHHVKYLKPLFPKQESYSVHHTPQCFIPQQEH